MYGINSIDLVTALALAAMAFASEAEFRNLRLEIFDLLMLLRIVIGFKENFSYFYEAFKITKYLYKTQTYTMISKII
jgi:hypothetical protein